jgi:hypothetical protein
MRQTAWQIANKWGGDGIRSGTTDMVLMNSKDNITECHIPQGYYLKIQSREILKT